MHTKYEKKKDGWHAETDIELGHAPKTAIQDEGTRVLTISTHKHDSGRLVSRASVSVVIVREGGYKIRSHAFNMGADPKGGDYSRRLMLNEKRCTEKSVTEQHHAALQMLPEILEQVKSHYQQA